MTTPESNTAKAFSSMDRLIEDESLGKGHGSISELFRMNAVADMLAGVHRGEITAKEAIEKVTELLQTTEANISAGENGLRRDLVRAVLRKNKLAIDPEDESGGTALEMEAGIDDVRVRSERIFKHLMQQTGG